MTAPTTTERAQAQQIARQQLARETYLRQQAQAQALKAAQLAALEDALQLAREEASWRRYHDTVETCA